MKEDNLSKYKSNKAIIFDSGTLISLSMTGLLNELKKLKEIFNGHFLITEEIKREIVDYPIQRKQYELEALRVKELIIKGILETPDKIGIDNKIIEMKAKSIVDMSEQIFISHKRPVKIIHIGEASCIALSKMLFEKNIKNVIAIDERTTRILIEKPENLKELLEKKLHTKIETKKGSFEYFKDLKVIRSAELLYVAWKKGVVELKDGNTILDALLYAVKFKGCAISSEEIEEIKRMK